MWPLKSAKINTISQKQIESHIFQHISTSWTFYSSLPESSYSAFSVLVSLQAFSQGSLLS